MRFDDLRIGKRFRFVMDGPICMKIRHVRNDRNTNFVYIENAGNFLGLASATAGATDVIPLVGDLDLPETKKIVNAGEPGLDCLS